jgi:hypothetical protein
VIHGNEPGGVKVVRSGLLAADVIAGRGGPAYHALILSAPNEGSAAIFKEMMMRNEEQIAEEVAQSYFGRIAVAKGKTESIFAVLSARGIPVNDEVKGRILACKDLATLDRWVRRAATVATADEVVAD